MGFNLGGVEAWQASDQLPAGTYLFRAATVERTQSSGGHPQVQVDWRVTAGEFAGAEQRDWVTVTEGAMGRVVQLIDACGVPRPTEDFDSLGALADWLAEMLKKGPVTEGIVRLKPGRKDPTKEFPEIQGFRKPGPGSDVSNDASGFGPRPAANGAAKADEPALPF